MIIDKWDLLYLVKAFFCHDSFLFFALLIWSMDAIFLPISLSFFSLFFSLLLIGILICLFYFFVNLWYTSFLLLKKHHILASAVQIYSPRPKDKSWYFPCGPICWCYIVFFYVCCWLAAFIKPKCCRGFGAGS